MFLGLFGLIGLGLAAATVYMAIVARKFGRATFEMSSVPGGCEARVCLACRRDSIGSSRLSYDVWKEEATVMTGSGVPVDFRVPFNLPQSDLPDMPCAGTMRVTWLLSIAASLPGVDYSAVFGVPVFATEASDQTLVTGDS